MHAHSDGPGHSSVFRVSLRLMVTVQHIRDPRRRHPAAPDGSRTNHLPVLNGSKILVVDDEPAANELVQTILVGVGAEMRVAASTRQALHYPGLLAAGVGEASRLQDAVAAQAVEAPEQQQAEVLRCAPSIAGRGERARSQGSRRPSFFRFFRRMPDGRRRAVRSRRHRVVLWRTPPA